MAKDNIGSLIYEWIVFLKVPSIILIVTCVFAKVMYQTGGVIWMIYTLIIGVIVEIASIVSLLNRTESFVSG